MHLIAQPDALPAAQRSELLRNYEEGLRDTCTFWFPRAVDREHGGFLQSFDRDGTLIDTDKSVWAQGRMSWMLLTLHNTVERRPEWLELGTHGLDFLDRHGFDQDGRMFFHLARDGSPLRKRRYAYSESFAAIAYAAHARATGNERSATRARELFDFFMRWNFTPGLMPAKFTDTRPMIGIGPRMIAIVTAQELRTNLGDDSFTAPIDRCIDEIRRLFLKPELGALMESVGPGGEVLDTFDGRMLNPGHALECAWFIMHEGSYRGDRQLVRLGCDILDAMWVRGWDSEYGGLLYFRDVFGKPLQEYWHDMKFWWPHNEAIIATLLAHLLTGDEKYRQWHRQVHDWAHRHFPDQQHGEWFGYLHRDGRISTTLKGNLWKSFFHLPRMQWYCAQLLRSQAQPCQGVAQAR
jgi:N-acylglucosamine 2-epimerase